MKIRNAFLAFALLTVSAGCATNLTKPSSLPKPSPVPFGTFENVEMKAVTISSDFSSSSANQKALKKIDEKLFEGMRLVFPKLKRIEAGQEFSSGDEKTLQITPHIKEIKFVSGATRFWVGSWAGSSAALMQVTFLDSSTGQTLSNPEFYQAANAFAGEWTIGGTDNAMLEEIARSVAYYATNNK